MVTITLLKYSKQNKILFVNCFRTQTLQITAVRLTEPEFTHVQFFKCKMTKDTL